jgi:signal transduction histidine kinase
MAILIYRRTMENPQSTLLVKSMPFSFTDTLSSESANSLAFLSVPQLGLKSTIYVLPLWDYSLDLSRHGRDAICAFEQNPLLPGILLVEQGQHVGLLSRRQLFERMSRPYSRELFTRRPLRNLYEFVETETILLPDTTLITEAVQKALERSPDSIYEPIIVETATGYRLLEMQQLLLAQSQIHTLLTTVLQQSEASARDQTKQLQQTLEQLQQTNAQLIQSEKLSALGQLVAGVAHEINNPVTFIAGNLTHVVQYSEELLTLVNLYQKHCPQPLEEIAILNQDADLEFIKEDFPALLCSMQTGVDRIRQIVLSLRNYARHDESDRKTVDIHEGIESTLIILKHRFADNATLQVIQLVKHYGNLPPVDCYPGALNQVFMNLLSNAIDALEEGAKTEAVPLGIQLPNGQTSHNPASSISPRSYIPMITIRTEHIGDRVQISISDNGVGIPEQIKRHLFSPFFTTKPVGKGTGLGLSISHQIVVDKHSGQMSCISKPGQGTEFQIEIPVSITHGKSKESRLVGE